MSGFAFIDTRVSTAGAYSAVQTSKTQAMAASTPVSVSTHAASTRTAQRADLPGLRVVGALALAAVVWGLVVLTSDFFASWHEGSMMVTWVAFWAVAFLGMALFGDKLRPVTTPITRALRNMRIRRAIDRNEQLIRTSAKNDPRVMADIFAAMKRAGVENLPMIDSVAPSFNNGKVYMPAGIMLRG